MLDVSVANSASQDKIDTAADHVVKKKGGDNGAVQPTGISVADNLRVLVKPGSVVEVRILGTPHDGVVSGYFDDTAKAAAEIAKWDGRASGVYFTMNPVLPALLARADNRLKPRAKQTTSDADILCRGRLLVDIDHERPSGTSATNEELQKCVDRATKVRKYLRDERGWGEGIIALSGNGVHLLWLIDLPNDREYTDLVRNALIALAQMFDEDGVQIDTSVFNAAQLTKVPGTWARKGDDTPDRPHRQSKLLKVPDESHVVDAEKLRELASTVKSKNRRTRTSSGNGKQYDVEALLSRHDLPVSKKKDHDGGVLWEFETCPVKGDQHPRKAFVRQDADGTMSAGCQHKHCFHSWAEFLELLEPDGGGNGCNRQERRRAEREAEPVPEVPPTLAFSTDILRDFNKMLYKHGVIGEDRVATVVYLALTSRLLDEPVSLAVKGPSSGGKSFVTKKVVDFFPASAYYALTAMSEHALTYSEEPLVHRILVVYESSGLEGEHASYLIRSLLSEGHIRYETVQKSRSGKMESRLVEREGPTGLLVTTTQVSLHPENETRLLSLPVNDSPAQTAAIMRRTAEKDDLGSRVDLGECVDLSEWRAFQSWLGAQDNAVAVPFAVALSKLVPAVGVRMRRDFKQVLNLVKAHAILNQCTRERDDDGRIIASMDDYRVVRELVADLVSDEVGATVPATVVETVTAVTDLNQIDPAGVTLVQLADRLGLDRSAASRRATVARKGGYIENLEDKRGKPARFVVAAPLPGEVTILPTVETLSLAVLQRDGGVQPNADPTADEPLRLPEDENATVEVETSLEEKIAWMDELLK